MREGESVHSDGAVAWVGDLVPGGRVRASPSGLARARARLGADVGGRCPSPGERCPAVPGRQAAESGQGRSSPHPPNRAIIGVQRLPAAQEDLGACSWA